MMRKLIALCGPQGAGKSTLAELMVPHGFIRTRFARPLKSMLWHLLVDQGVDTGVADRMIDGDLKETPTRYLDGRTPRHAMQTLGTEWRDLISRDLWLNVWERQMERLSNNSWVVDDLRFLHEAERVKKLGGIVVIISRPGCGPGTHLSEREYLQIAGDAIIMNDGGPENMLRQLKAFIGESL